MKKLLKKKDGFTLVELIVVIAILAILAAVAIPAYSGYISKAHEAADYTTLDAVLTAATFAAMDYCADANISQVNVTTSDSKISVTFTTSDTTKSSPYTLTSDEVTMYLGSFPTFKSTKFSSGATWYKESGSGHEAGWN